MIPIMISKEPIHCGLGSLTFSGLWCLKWLQKAVRSAEALEMANFALVGKLAHLKTILQTASNVIRQMKMALKS